jgi:hypothetical protein
MPATVTVTDSRLKLYPNPASQYMRIELETPEPVVVSDYLVEIYGITGQLHARVPYTGNDIDISGYAPGLYIVRLIHGKSGKSHTQKIIIQ